MPPHLTLESNMYGDGGDIKTVVWDVDGVLADFVLDYTALIEKHHGLPRFGTAAQDRWHSSDDSLDGAEIDHIWHDHIWASPSFWLDLKPLFTYGDALAIWTLYRMPGVEFAYVTNRTGPEESVIRQTTQWLLRHELPVAPVIVTRNKVQVVRELPNVVGIIEDAEKNINAYVEARLPIWARDWPFNRNTKVMHTEYGPARVSSPGEFAFRMKQRIEKQWKRES